METPAAPGTPLFLIAASWVCLGVVAVLYTHDREIPIPIALPFGLALACELPFYLMAGRPPAWLARPVVAVLSGLLPYLVYSLPTGVFSGARLILLALVTALLACWFAVVPRRFSTDLLYVAVVAAIVLSRLMDWIYLKPMPGLPVAILGQLMMTRTAAIGLIGIGGRLQAQFSLWPRLEDWRIGLRWFAVMLLPMVAILWATGLWMPRPQPRLAKALPHFLGFLWVGALREEFLFRSILQASIEDRFANRAGAVAVTALLFGCTHLWFRNAFPNWQFALVATVFGLFCGLSWRENRSVSAAVVTHALGATCYRAFLQ